MNELVQKLSSYNIFNYLLPGIVFVVLADALTIFHFVQKDIVIGVFLYYFVGLIISRLGSILVEPALKRVKFVVFSPYTEFISASKVDDSIAVLSEANNMYRTFCSLLLSLVVLKGYEHILMRFPVIEQWTMEFLVVGLLVLFLFSYRKQSQYITRRIEHANKKG